MTIDNSGTKLSERKMSDIESAMFRLRNTLESLEANKDKLEERLFSILSDDDDCDARSMPEKKTENFSRETHKLTQFLHSYSSRFEELDYSLEEILSKLNI